MCAEGADNGRTASANAREAPGGDYNLLPYPSMPFAYTQPAHLAALTSLFKFEAPAAQSARILELGCASGGNIVPLAARFPHARFLGIDLSQRHVDDAQQRIVKLGLANVEIRQGDLATISLAAHEFDYVICHGVFSWVPKAVQDAIFRICEETLAPNGVAAVSYNVLPGWHLRSVVRDICLHHVGMEGPPRERVAGARQVLAQIAQSVSETEPYGLLLRNEARRIAQLPGSYILGEFLAPDNAPCLFHEFAERAGRYGLSYLCEGDLRSSISETLFPETEARIRGMAGQSRSALEQYKDFVTGRPFRRSVLVRTAQMAAVQSRPTPDRLRRLHFASRLHFDPERSTQSVSIYKDARGRAITAEDPAVRRAFARLEKSYPATLTLEQLAAFGAGDEDCRPADAEARICDALFTLLAAGQATMSALPLDVGSAAGERPCVWLLARTEAASRQPWLTSLQHDAVALHPIPAVLIPLLDGNSDRQMLTRRLAEALQRGEVRIPELQADQLETGSTHAHAVAADYIERTIQFLSKNALLDVT